jgi:hypothetical protein
MKNPWMSLWLSAANQAAGAARVFWLVEMRRQQRLFMREMARTWASAPGARRSEPKRRDK